jgi:hypothetical protein
MGLVSLVGAGVGLGGVVVGVGVTSVGVGCGSTAVAVGAITVGALEVQAPKTVAEAVSPTIFMNLRRDNLYWVDIIMLLV